MDHPTLVTVFVIIAAVAIVIQMLVLLGLFLMVWKVYKQAMFVSRETRRYMDTIVQAALDTLAQSRDPVKAITANLAEVSRVIRERTIGLDISFGEFLVKTRVQLERADMLLSDLMDRIEATAAAVERGVFGPLRQASALARALSAGVDAFFFRRRTVARETAQDEEMFI